MTSRLYPTISSKRKIARKDRPTSFAERGIARGIRHTEPGEFPHFSHFPRIARTYVRHRGCRHSGVNVHSKYGPLLSIHMASPNLIRHLSASGMKIYFTLTGVFIPRFIARMFRES